MTALARPLLPTPLVGPRSVAIGVAGAAGLLGVYLAIISLAQGAEHALAQLAADAPFVGLFAAGFGTQIALFAELRAVDRHHRAAAAVTAAGTGTSAAAMLACCATTSSTCSRWSGCQRRRCSSTPTGRRSSSPGSA